MECKDCDKNGDCEYQLYTTTAMERANGEYHFIKGCNCPKDWQDKKAEDMTEEQRSYEPIYDEPPLGCKPAQLVCTDRIKVVADAISRYADSPKFNSQLVRRWATEIELQCDIFERC